MHVITSLLWSSVHAKIKKDGKIEDEQHRPSETTAKKIIANNNNNHGTSNCAWQAQ